YRRGIGFWCPEADGTFSGPDFGLIRRFGDRGHDAVFGMHAPRRAFGPNRFDTALGQRPQEVPEHFLPTAYERGRETPPEHSPASTHKVALPPHVVGPFVRAVVLVAVALDCKASIVVPFNYHVNAIRAGLDLWRHAVATLREFVVHLAFEARLAELPQVLYTHLIFRKGRVEVFNEATAQVRV